MGRLDGANETLWNKYVDDFMICLYASEPCSHWQNLVETDIRELKGGATDS